MALYTRANLCRLLNISQAVITMAVKRGHLVLTDGKIDDALSPNDLFIAKKLSKPDAAQTPQEDITEKKTLPPPDDDKEDFQMIARTNSNELVRLKTLKDKIWIKKTNEDYEIAKIKKEKMKGEVIPVELIKNLFQAHTQSIVSAQKDGIEDLLIQISAESRMKGDQLARLRGKMVAILNTGVEKSVNATKRNLKAIVSAYSLKREVGERG